MTYSPLHKFVKVQHFQNLSHDEALEPNKGDKNRLNYFKFALAPQITDNFKERVIY